MNILYATCFLDVSGVTRLNYDILARLAGKNNIYVCETASDGRLTSKLENHFRDSFGEPFKLFRYPLQDRYRRFLEYLDSNAIDLVFNTHSLWVYEHIAKLKKDRSNLKVVDSLHVLEPYCFRGGYPDISANRYVHPFIDKSIVISEHLLSYIKRSYSVDPGKFIIIRNGVDTTRFKKDSSLKGIFRNELGVPANFPLIGYIGRFSRQKRPDVFLDVAKHLLGKLGEVYFYMAGDGDLLDKSKKLADSLGISNRVSFVAPRDDIHIVLNSTDMLVLTSSYEGAPLTILEALATGVPVVASDVGAISEYVGTPYVVQRQGRGSEVDQFAEAILRGLNDNYPSIFDREIFSLDYVADSYARVFYDTAVRTSTTQEN